MIKPKSWTQMQKSQLRNVRNMRKKCRMIPQKVNNSTIMASKDSNVHRTSDLCLSFKSMIKNNQQNEEDMNKCMNEF
jgi:hypothetical protein